MTHPPSQRNAAPKAHNLEAELTGRVELALRPVKAQLQADILGILEEVDQKLRSSATEQERLIKTQLEADVPLILGQVDEKLRASVDEQRGQVQALLETADSERQARLEHLSALIQEGLAHRFQSFEDSLLDLRAAMTAALTPEPPPPPPAPTPPPPPADPQELMELRRRLKSSERAAAAFHDERRRASWYAQELARAQDATLTLKEEVAALCWQIEDLRTLLPSARILSAAGARSGLIETSWPDAEWRDLAVGWRNADQVDGWESAPVELVTPATPWEYGGFSDVISPGDHGGVIRLDLIVQEGSVGVLVTDEGAGSTHGTELILNEAEEPQTAYLDLPADGSSVRIVLRNSGEGAAVGRVRVERISLITLDDVEPPPAGPATTGEWKRLDTLWTPAGGAELASPLPMTFEIPPQPWAFAAVSDVISDIGEGERAFELTVIPRTSKLGVLAISADGENILSEEAALPGDDRPTTVRITARNGGDSLRLVCRNHGSEAAGAVSILYVRMLVPAA